MQKSTCIIPVLGVFLILFVDLPLAIIAIINVALLVYCFSTITKIQQGTFTPFNIILACLFLFHCGHLWLTFIDSDVQKWDFLFDYYASEFEQVRVYSYVTQMLIVFYIVGVFSLNKQQEKTDDILPFEKTSSIFNVFFFLSFFICLYYDIQRAIRVSLVGYGSGFTYESGFAYTLSTFLNGLFILMFLINRRNKKMLIILVSLVLLRSYIVMFLVGNRGASVVFLILVIFLLSKYSMYKDCFSNKSVIASMSIALTIVLPLISLTRNDYVQVDSISAFVVKYNPFSYFLAEFGGTIKTVILAFQHSVPKFENGAQFFYSSLALFPGSDAMFGSTYRQYVSIARELNHLEGIGGLGGSLIANVYLNFKTSILAFVTMGLLSKLTCYFCNKLNQTNLTLYHYILFFGMFAGMLTAVRGEWYDFITQLKTSIYLIALLWAASKLGVKLYR